MKIFAIVLLSALYLHAADAWSYIGATDGVAKWKDTYPICGRQQQSPINVVDGNAVCQDIPPIRLVGWEAMPTNMEISNNGHSISVYFDGSFNVTGGGLGDVYAAAQFHFHWGADNTKGSEHTVDGRAYPLEIHFVNYNTKYGNLSNAVDKSDGLAVLGVFFDTTTADTLADRPIPSTDNQALDRVLDHIQKASHKGNKSAITPFSLLELAPRQAELADFYRYDGSLTTPPCFESVTWTVFKWINYVSEKQMDQFRAIFENSKEDADVNMVDNYRPVQSLNGRIVKNSMCDAAQYLLPSIALLATSLLLQMF